jgi:hypothetical protein
MVADAVALSLVVIWQAARAVGSAAGVVALVLILMVLIAVALVLAALPPYDRLTPEQKLARALAREKERWRRS